MIHAIDHLGIAVRNLEDGLQFWAEALGLEVEGIETVEGEGVKVAFLPAGRSRIELLESIAEDGPIGRYLVKRGGGIHHLTLATDDLAGLLAQLEAKGVATVGEAPRIGAGGRKVAFLHPSSTGGVLVELVEEVRETPRARAIAPGAPVLVYLRDPQEKLWGVLRRLDQAGLVLEGIDLSSFDDWVAQIERGEESVVGPSVLYLPSLRIEKLILDRSSGQLPSLAERFFRRTGRRVSDVLDGEGGA